MPLLHHCLGAPVPQEHSDLAMADSFSSFNAGQTSSTLTHRVPEQMVDRIRTQKMFDSPGWQCSIQHAGHKKMTHRLRWVITLKTQYQCITRHTESAMARKHPDNGKCSSVLTAIHMAGISPSEGRNLNRPYKRYGINGMADILMDSLSGKTLQGYAALCTIAPCDTIPGSVRTAYKPPIFTCKGQVPLKPSPSELP